MEAFPSKELSSMDTPVAAKTLKRNRFNVGMDPVSAETYCSLPNKRMGRISECEIPGKKSRKHVFQIKLLQYLT